MILIITFSLLDIMKSKSNPDILKMAAAAAKRSERTMRSKVGFLMKSQMNASSHCGVKSGCFEQSHPMCHITLSATYLEPTEQSCFGFRGVPSNKKFKGTCCHLLVTCSTACSTACPLLHHSWQCPCWAAFDFSMLWLNQNYSLGIVMQLKHHSSLTHTCWCVFPLLSSVCESWHALGQLGLLRTCRPPSPSPLGKPNQTHPRLVEAHPLVLHLFKALYRSESLPQYNISLHRRMMVKNEWQHCIWDINGFLALTILWVLSY